MQREERGEGQQDDDSDDEMIEADQVIPPSCFVCVCVCSFSSALVVVA